MNYVKELKAFKDWLLLNDLDTSAIALWYTLMSINNMAGWKERFNAPNSTVEKLTGLSKQGLVNARKNLIDNDLIVYEKGKKNKAPAYQMKSLVNSVDPSGYQSIYQSEYPSGYQSNDESLTIPKQKRDGYEEVEDEEKTRAEDPYVIYQENFGVMRPMITESISDWCSSFSAEIVVAAMKRGIKQNARSFAYIESILRDWSQQGIKTINDIKAYEKQTSQPSKTIPFPKQKDQRLETLQRMREKGE
ncbi:DnaD domain protein [Salicibibacter cibarius]|uniref:DnaD domain protein n=1 Tax=Salicibibacter cibarius TaxID=2743000 RepID=A0A7T6Z6L7_9BACI|nr:DnaD domain protein [Salicibibacter cibarius]QQK77844.1 DnaD domain protein [Salicibibacter cibarius]